jgi:hypothetical protein
LRNFYEKRSAKQYEKIFLGLFSWYVEKKNNDNYTR